MLFLIDSTSNNLNISNQNGLFYFFMIFSKRRGRITRKLLKPVESWHFFARTVVAFSASAVFQGLGLCTLYRQ